MEEELIFKAVVKDEAQGIELLKCVQAIVNTFGVEMIINTVRNLEKNSNLLGLIPKK